VLPRRSVRRLAFLKLPNRVQAREPGSWRSRDRASLSSTGDIRSNGVGYCRVHGVVDPGALRVAIRRGGVFRLSRALLEPAGSVEEHDAVGRLPRNTVPTEGGNPQMLGSVVVELPNHGRVTSAGRFRIPTDLAGGITHDGAPLNEDTPVVLDGTNSPNGYAPAPGTDLPSEVGREFLQEQRCGDSVRSARMGEIEFTTQILLLHDGGAGWRRRNYR